jgi:hypothetical protein
LMADSGAHLVIRTAMNSAARSTNKECAIQLAC